MEGVRIYKNLMEAGSHYQELGLLVDWGLHTAELTPTKEKDNATSLEGQNKCITE